MLSVTRWSNRKEHWLREHYRNSTREEVLTAIPGHSWGSIRRRASAIHASRRRALVHLRCMVMAQQALLSYRDGVRA